MKGKPGLGEHIVSVIFKDVSGMAFMVGCNEKRSAVAMVRAEYQAGGKNISIRGDNKVTWMG